MALTDRNGRTYDDSIAYAESKGYSRIPGTTSYRAPNGRTVSRAEAANIAVTDAKAGNLYPDQEHLAEFRGYGYTGPEASEAAAQNFAEKELAGFEFQSLIDEKTGLLQSPYNLQTPESILNTYKGIVEQYGLPGYEKAMNGADELSNIARSTGFSPYATAQLERQALEEASLRDRLQTQLGTARTSALSNLASTGGYDSGARERVSRNIGISGMMGGQELARSGAQSRADIGASDALYKQNLLSSMPLTYSNLASTGTNLWNPYLTQATKEQDYGYNTSKYNIDKAIAEKAGARDFDLEKFKLQKQLESSAKQSYAENPSPYSYQKDIYK